MYRIYIRIHINTSVHIHIHPTYPVQLQSPLRMSFGRSVNHTHWDLAKTDVGWQLLQRDEIKWVWIWYPDFYRMVWTPFLGVLIGYGFIGWFSGVKFPFFCLNSNFLCIFTIYFGLKWVFDDKFVVCFFTAKMMKSSFSLLFGESLTGDDGEGNWNPFIWDNQRDTLPETNITPKNGWLED